MQFIHLENVKWINKIRSSINFWSSFFGIVGYTWYELSVWRTKNTLLCWQQHFMSTRKKFCKESDEKPFAPLTSRNKKRNLSWKLPQLFTMTNRSICPRKRYFMAHMMSCFSPWNRGVGFKLQNNFAKVWFYTKPFDVAIFAFHAALVEFTTNIRYCWIMFHICVIDKHFDF